MRLISAHVAGYKRFRTLQKIDLNGPLIAIVGANEAGKSSLLRALHRIEDGDGFARDEPTRRTAFEGRQEVVKLSYLLEDSDRDAVKSTVAPGDKEPRWLHVMKHGSGEVYYEAEPAPRPAFNLRAEEVSLLTEFIAQHPDVLADDESEPSLIDRADIESLNASWGDSAREQLEDVVIVLRRVQTALESFGTEEAKELAERIDAAAERELMPAPHQRAINILNRRRPRMLFFDESARNLPTEFDLVDLDSASKGLLNLARLGDLDLNILRGAMEIQDTAHITELLNAANAKVAEFFEVWNQFDVSVEFARGDGTLLVIHATTDTNGLSRFDERSEGLKIFVALVAMVGTSETELPPIVLIDEVELHLHYDAEADLIRFFGEQSAATQIIYTTHSAGCLPGDLGTGVRVVRRIDETNDSEIQNRFWTEDQGYRPMLYAMGAATLSFIPLRDAVIAEGASELILLPSLLREVTGQRVLDFHVTTGAAEVRPARIAGLDLEAPRVVYLLDSDSGGQDHKDKLLAAGIPRERILSVDEDDLVLEDVIDGEVYIAAVDQTLSMYTELRFPAERLTEAGRPAAVKAWCKENDIAVPGKIQVCHAIVEQRVERPLVGGDRQELLRDLHGRIETGLKFRD